MSRIAETFAELYSLVPQMADCKGLCRDSCLNVNPAREASEYEHARLRRAGVPDLPAGTPDGAGIPCPALTAKGRCSQYAIRPMICRLWGAAPSMHCEHGCTPVEWLSDAQAVELLLASLQAGGHPDFPSPEVLQEMRDILYDAELQPYVVGVIRERRNPERQTQLVAELMATLHRRDRAANGAA